jgi:sugar lactone lactonase YvrE
MAEEESSQDDRNNPATSSSEYGVERQLEGGWEVDMAGVSRRFLIVAAIAALAGGLLVRAPGARADVAGAGAQVTVFADVPAPGTPFGVVVRGSRVYVSTAAGNPTSVNTEGERVFAFTASGHLIDQVSVTEGPASNMGLYGMTFDAAGRLYVADMNGMVRRFKTQPKLSALDMYAVVPAPYSQLGWYGSMWNDLEFDADGSAYVSDGNGRIWRLDRSGRPAIWFQDPRLLEPASIAGPYALRIGPDHNLYFVLAATFADGRGGDSIVYRLPLIPHPGPSDLHVFHRYTGEGTHFSPGGEGLAFGRSGRLYVALNGDAAISVLRTDGSEEKRIHSPLLQAPVGLAFQGTNLLVAECGLRGYRPEMFDDTVSHLGNQASDAAPWRILRVRVGEPGLNRPEPHI